MTLQRQRLQRAPTKPKAPRDLNGWNDLARKAIERARAAGDRREHSIRLAIQKGMVESLLRQWGIICEADITREFPPPQT